MTTLELKLDKETGIYGPAIAQVLESSDGELSAFGVGALVRQVAGFDILDVPVGRAIVGAAGAGLADAAIHFIEPLIPRVGLMSAGQRRALLLFLGAAGVQFGPIKKFLSAPGADAASFVLALDSLVTVFNARGLVGGFLEKLAPGSFSHRSNGQTLAQQQGRAAVAPGRNRGGFVNSPAITPARAMHLGV